LRWWVKKIENKVCPNHAFLGRAGNSRSNGVPSLVRSGSWGKTKVTRVTAKKKTFVVRKGTPLSWSPGFKPGSNITTQAESRLPQGTWGGGVQWISYQEKRGLLIR